MLGNLIENACQWCRHRVEITAARDGAAVVIRIEDDGPGLDAQARKSVMERGRRLDESRPDNGFGLPIALELVELYGGSLALEASKLVGFKVQFILST